MKKTDVNSAAALGVSLLAVCVTATAQEKPGKLRSEMAKAEKEYFDLYNKINTDPQFAIVCKMDTPTGSNFAVRVCQPRYLLNAKEKAATERMQAAVAAADSGSSNTRGPNVGSAIGGSGTGITLDKDEAFRQNMLAAQQKSPELQALGKKRDDLQARYEAALKGKGGDR